MNKPMPVQGSTAIINEQSQTIKEQHRAIVRLRDDNARLVNVIARALDDMKHHACVTDNTLRVMQDTHKRFTENER